MSSPSKTDDVDRRRLRRLYERMSVAAGARHWWPCDRSGPGGGRDEIIIGAILTQNTSWKNVELALGNLKAAGLCDLAKLSGLEPAPLAALIRPAGYFNLKARRLLAVAQFFAPGGRLRYKALAAWDDHRLREALLDIWGVGPETADSILLYAMDRLSFVIDAYTLRIGRRHGLFDEPITYQQARAWFHQRVEADRQIFNEYHALLVWIGNRFCKPKPRCSLCPLARRDCFASTDSWRLLQPYRNP